MGIEALYRAADMAGFAMAGTEEVPILRSLASRRARVLYPTTERPAARTASKSDEVPTISQRVGNFIGSFGAKQPA